MNEHAALAGWQSVVGRADVEPMKTATNPLWRVTGEDGRRWVLKRLPRFSPGVGPVEEFRVLGHLRSAGLPVAVPVITDDGRIAHNAENLRAGPGEKQPTGAHAYTLIPWLDGDPGLSESAELAYAIGSGIGRLERALADCPWPVTSYADDPAEEILGERLTRMPEELRTLATARRERLYGAIADLPVQRITHGDCNLGNVLVHDGAVWGFLDLDHLPAGPRIRDLSYYLASRLGAQLDHGDPAAFAAVLPRYVEGFHALCPLTDRERAAVLPMMITVAIGGAAWRLEGWTPDPDGYRRELRAVGWLVQHYDASINDPACAFG